MTTSTKVRTAHQARLTYVYVRQSSLQQVNRNRESTDLQYRLVERAHQLGWPQERIQVIDEDLGKSGASSVERQGFQRLVSEIGLGRVGLVLSMDASRLARNNSDWYRLLELCSVFDTLIGDREQIYHPRLYSDRMLLGLTGMMSEAELHHIKQRMQAGALNKAERGELRLPLPAGLERLRDGTVILNADAEVQARIRLVFSKFQELGTARAVVRYLHQEQLLLPTRPIRGPAPHEVKWQLPRASVVLGILKNPAYAGAYAYGRQTTDPARRKPGRPRTGIISRPIDKWPVLLHNIYPAYISWEDYLANQKQLQANQQNYFQNRVGAPRQGQTLLQGLVRCAACGMKMHVHYSGLNSDFPVYRCPRMTSDFYGSSCQEVRGWGLDAEVERLLLAALEPDQVEIALAAVRELEQEYASLHKHWQLRLERADYEAERARRQYHAVEPENRLVASTLEREWETKLREQEQVGQDYEHWRQQNPLTLTEEDRAAVLALAQDLPRLWHAPTTMVSDRKRIVRLLIKEVLVDQNRERGKVWFQINWATGAVSEHRYKRRVKSYDEHADLEAIEQCVRALHAQRKMDAEIAEELNERGYLTTKRRPFNGDVVWFLRKRWELPSVVPPHPNPTRWEDGSWTVRGLAQELGVYPGTIYTWLRKGRLQGQQLAKGMPWHIDIDAEGIETLRQQLRRDNRSKKEAS